MKLRMFGALSGLVIVLLAGCLLLLTEVERIRRTHAVQSDSRANVVSEDGRYCAKCGVSAEANPFTGDLGAAWLHGWITGRDEVKRNQQNAR